MIENLLLGYGDDEVIANSATNYIVTGEGDDVISNIGINDTIYGEDGNDDFYATSFDFNLIDGGPGFDYVTVNQMQLDSGLYSIDLRSIPNGKIQNVEAFYYGESVVGGRGQILMSLDTFIKMNVSSLTIKATWIYDVAQAIGLDGDFKLLGSTDSYDVYIFQGIEQN